MTTPIYKALLDYINKDISRLHMPGHKGKNVYNINNLWQYDITEIENLDNLLDSQGVIKQTEDIYKKIYNSKLSVITTQGSTLGIQMMLTASIMATKNKSKKIIIDRNVHISAINTMALLDLEPIWIFRNKFIDRFSPGQILLEDLERVIINNPEAQIVYITSPNYFGQVEDLKSISKICKKYNKFLLVDNAHGAHFKFISKNLHPMEFECSACCDSLHKTLPVLTGGALLHVFDERLIKYIKKSQRIYSSTSPSYLTMLSIDRLVSYIFKNLKKDYDLLFVELEKLKDLAKINGLDILESCKDPTKFVFGSGIFNCSANELAEILRKNKIEPEYVSEYWIVLMFSPQNNNKDFERLKEFINNINNIFEKIKLKNNFEFFKNFKPQRRLSIREALMSDFKTVSLLKSLGKVSASSVVTCPPCVPVVTPGEIINQEVIDLLSKQKVCFIDIVC
ncbi:MAG: aminotransferase class I/II-fold pyridoxal phosphate-dependent enzyme [Oscillospiraceae bacterium]|nr:aminotransferase class I/II-fold pyridoxal phosphate-dependent enzyme [Oscillospiraceae bacterium]